MTGLTDSRDRNIGDPKHLHEVKNHADRRQDGDDGFEYLRHRDVCDDEIDDQARQREEND